MSPSVSIGTPEFAVFDCDGVILQSNHLKSNAFAEALSNEPSKLVEQLVDYHKRHGGISRREKFKYYFRELKGESNEALVDQACERFAKICQEGLVRVNTVPGIEAFLEELECPCVVVTGGNEKEVVEVLEQRGLASRFEAIRGNPVSKRDNMKRLHSEGFFTGRGIYFGDSRLDYQLAIEYSQDFVFVSGFSEWADIAEKERAGFLLETEDFTSLI